LNNQSKGAKNDSWEQMGAASGLFATLLFVAAFIIFLTTDPGGGNTPTLPDVANAKAAPAFFADHLEAIRAQVMLNSIGIVVFLWFLGTLWSVLREAEGSPGRGSVIASAGAIVGVALTLVGLMLTGASTSTTSLAQAETVPTLYTAAALSFAFGGAAFTVFFLGVAEVSLRTGGVPRWLGYLAVLAAAASVFGFVTPYASSGIFNPATGALGFYAHYIAFVLWVFLASAALTLAQHRRGREAAPRPVAGAEGATP
jgi:hypothetical protein